jgi:hypothetical protein
MIVVENKSVEDILQMIAPYKKVLVAGCYGCVTVCLAGGEKEVGLLASQIRMARQKEGNPIEVLEQTVERQCDKEYLDKFQDNVREVEAVVSLACGIGIQYLASDNTIRSYLSSPCLPSQESVYRTVRRSYGKP